MLLEDMSLLGTLMMCRTIILILILYITNGCVSIEPKDDKLLGSKLKHKSIICTKYNVGGYTNDTFTRCETIIR